MSEGNVTISGSTSFTGNSAGMGGAIYGRSVVTASNASFSGNNASYYGGAIYSNDGNIIVSNATFSGNKAGSGGAVSTIYGNVTVSNASFSGNNARSYGGITGNGAVALSGGKLNLGTSTVNAGTFNMTGGTLGIDIINANSAGTYGKVVADTIDITGGILNLTIANPDGMYALLNGDILNLGYELSYADDMFTVTDNKDGTFIITRKTSNVGNSNQNSVTNGLMAYINAGGVDPTIKNVVTRLQTNRAEGLYALDTLAPTSSRLALSNHEAITNRLFSHIISRTEQRSASMETVSLGSSLWLQTLYNHAHQSNSASATGFSTGTLGFVMGADTKVSDSLTIGAAYSYARSEAKSVGKEIGIDMHTFLAYGRKDWNKLHLDGAVHFAYAHYDEDKNILGAKHTARYSSTALGANAMLGYDLGSVTPEAGLRYQYVSFGDYTDSLGQKVHSNSVSALTAVLGGTYKKSFVTSKGVLTSKVRLAATYDLAAKDGITTTSLPGATYQIIGKKLNRLGAEGGLGLDWQYGDWTFSADYAVNLREKYNSQSVMLKLQYKF